MKNKTRERVADVASVITAVLAVLTLITCSKVLAGLAVIGLAVLLTFEEGRQRF